MIVHAQHVCDASSDLHTPDEASMRLHLQSPSRRCKLVVLVGCVLHRSHCGSAGGRLNSSGEVSIRVGFCWEVY